MFRINLYRKSKHTFCDQLHFSENRAVCEIMWKNIVERGRQQMTIWRMRIAYWIPKATHTIRISNTYCFPNATMVAKTRLFVTLYAHWLSCYKLQRPYNVSDSIEVLR